MRRETVPVKRYGVRCNGRGPVNFDSLDAAFGAVRAFLRAPRPRGQRDIVLHDRVLDTRVVRIVAEPILAARVLDLPARPA